MDLMGCFGGAILGIFIAAFAVFEVLPMFVPTNWDQVGPAPFFLFALVALPAAVLGGIAGALFIEYSNRK